jgi:alpha-amylase/alpha-mannosidase (GH57 family)
MHDVSVAFFWHHHQPYYTDDLTGETPLPWVRLHGVKDYWGMAKLLEQTPEFHGTINLVPSLLVQLEAYAEGGRVDNHLRISRLPPDSLSEEDLHYMLDNFFMAYPEQMIRPYPRYEELYRKRGFGVDPPERARKRFSKRDLLDLQCWANLVWFHPIAFELDKDLADFRVKGRGWTEREKQWLLDKQLEILREVIPLHRRLLERGQVELTTSPFYHPIVPLLWDKRLARRAMPEAPLPELLESYAEDAVEQIRRAVAYHEKVFGQKPRGMWPSEGSVCQGMIPAVADAGIQWIATDEEILSCSTDGWVCRDMNGYLRNPEMLYRPWRVEEAGRSLQVIFRDHAMSDLIGFQYQHYGAEQAVQDFVGKLEAIGRATHRLGDKRPTLVSIILDGENCWEYYPRSGVDFLRGLYRRIVEHPKITPMRVCDYLAKYPATDRLGHLFPGSWIQHNFSIWIGHPECNRAWDLVSRTRRQLVKATAAKKASEENLRRAWEELYIAEGSDWFWWFDPRHQTAHDMVFDRLFRKHLQNVYSLLGETPPVELARPIRRGLRIGVPTEPTSLLQVRIDGRRSYFEWINAGHYQHQTGRGSMQRARESRVSDVYFGFDMERLLVRVDAQDGPVRERWADLSSLRLVFLEPAQFVLSVMGPARRHPLAQLFHAGVLVVESGVEAAADWILEIAVPLRSLGVGTGAALHFCLELYQAEKLLERVPLEGAIETTVPPPEYELIMWQV